MDLLSGTVTLILNKVDWTAVRAATEALPVTIGDDVYYFEEVRPNSASSIVIVPPQKVAA